MSFSGLEKFGVFRIFGDFASKKRKKKKGGGGKNRKRKKGKGKKKNTHAPFFRDNSVRCQIEDM